MCAYFGGNYEERPNCTSRVCSAERGLTVHDLEEALRHTAPGGTAVTHVPGNVTPGGRMPYSHECYREGAWNGGRELSQEDNVRERIRRNHRKIDLVNRGINSRSSFSQVHPKLRIDGSYPKEFQMARTVEDFRAMDISVLDRILSSYNIPSEVREKTRESVRTKKLSRLYEYLGADHLITRGEGNFEGKQERYISW